jgi:hypothetical protein
LLWNNLFNFRYVRTNVCWRVLGSCVCEREKERERKRVRERERERERERWTCYWIYIDSFCRWVWLTDDMSEKCPHQVCLSVCLSVCLIMYFGLSDCLPFCKCFSVCLCICLNILNACLTLCLKCRMFVFVFNVFLKVCHKISIDRKLCVKQFYKLIN